MTALFPNALDTFATNHVSGQLLSSAEYNDLMDAVNKIERNMRQSETVVVAASNAPSAWKTMAKYTCTGFADEDVINQALADLVNSGTYGTVVLSNGLFNITNAPVSLPAAPVALTGQTGTSTLLKGGVGLAQAICRIQGPLGPQQYGDFMQRVAFLGIDGSLTSSANAHGLELTGSVYQGMMLGLKITNAKGHSTFLRASCIVQWINTFGGPTGGTFTLSYNGQTTGPIAYNASAGTVQTALRGLSTINANVTCTGGPLPGTAIICTFTGPMAVPDTLAITVSTSLTGGSSPSMAVWAGERPAYNRMIGCNVVNGSRDAFRSGDVFPTGWYAEHNEAFGNSFTFHTGNGIFSTGNNNRFYGNQIDFVDIGVYLLGCENNAVMFNTHDRCATHCGKIEQGGNHSFGFNQFGDRQAGFSAGSKMFYLTGNTSGDKFGFNTELNQFAAGGNGWDYGFYEDAGVGQSGVGFWGPSTYSGNGFSWTRNGFGGSQPMMGANTSSDFTLAGVTSPVHYGIGVPSNTMGLNGFYYFRMDTPGTANQRLYVKSAGAWVGIV